MTEGEKKLWAALYAAHYTNSLKAIQERGERLTVSRLHGVISNSVEEASFGVEGLRDSMEDLLKGFLPDSVAHEALLEVLEGCEREEEAYRDAKE